MPQPLVDGVALDELIGPGFGVVTDDAEVAARAVERWGDLAEVVRVPTGRLEGVLPPGGAIIVRPDRYVAAVAADADQLDDAGSSLLACIAPARRSADA